ncbi:hypothetical protein BH11ARM1_BH11ARM1_14060 [soil metagenome]
MSAYRRLYIWVEGADDERFFRSLIGTQFEQRFDEVTIRPYAGMPSEKVGNFLSSIKAMQAEYIFVADIDNSPCITSKKEALLTRYKHLESGRIVIVKKEIESWYRAGLDASACGQLGFKQLSDTEAVTKEQFHANRPTRFQSGIDFMIEVLKHFDSGTACAQNKSFAYFCGKYGLL